MKKNLNCYGPPKPYLNWKKLLLTMKITVILLFCGLINLLAEPGYSQSTKISLNMEDATIESVLNEIEEISEFYFLFNHKLIDVNRKVDVNADKKPISDILDEIFRNDVRFIVSDRQVVLFPKEGSDKLLNLIQQGIVTGKITDATTGEAMPGVNIQVKGTSLGTITNNSGEYSISVPDLNATLVFSFIGYRSQEVFLGGRTILNIALENEMLGLDEVVVIGYGTQKRVTVTGSVISKKGEDIARVPAPNIINSFIGLTPGVIINNRSGEPGRDDPTLFIRGRSTTGNNSPLVIIDGVERSGLGRINPYDIESISILKDASAAIYGARASNGVILVTTKRGQEGKPTIDFTMNQGFAQPTRVPKMADAFTFAQVTNEIEAREGRAPKYTEEELQKFKDGTDPNYPNTDWYDFILKPLTPQRRSNISLRGGTEQVNYFISIGEVSQSGHFKFNTREYSQYNFRSNIDAKVTEHIKVGLSVAGRLEDRHYPYINALNLHINTFLYLPTWSPYWPGTEYLRPLRGGDNLVNFLSDNFGYNDQVYKNLENTLTYKVDLPWIKGLSINGSLNYDIGYNHNKSFFQPTYVYNYSSTTNEYTLTKTPSGNNASLSERFDQTAALTINSFINYERSFGSHNINALFGYEQREGSFNYLTAGRVNFASPALPELFAGSSVKTDQSNDGKSSKFARQNYSGRLTYDYSGKYLAQVIFRYDGSQNFPSDKRFGFFPGISLGWRLSEESFIKNLGFIDNLKIRGSYGELGNDLVAAFQYLTAYTFGSNYVLGNKDVLGLVQSGVPNPRITWEVAKTSNIGFEAALWKGLLGVELDLFNTRRSNILTKRTVVVPDYTGLLLPDENIGIVDNKGFELQLSHVNMIGKLKYTLGGNFSFARNKVIFADEPPAAEEYQKLTGRPIGSGLYYKATGIFATQADVDNYPHLAGAKPGDIIYEDVNKDGIINVRDQIRINETPIPEIVFGLTASVEYAGFDFSMLLQGQENASVGGYPFDLLSDFSYTWGNFTMWRANNRWTPDNINATMPRSDIARRNNNNLASTHWLMDMGFLRLKNIELGYSIPSNLTNKLNIQNLRIYLSGHNLFYIYDNLKEIGLDPEATDLRYYSQERILNIGLNLTF
jgi:TonB-linked SusC/RagA family outer membrane protein